MQGYRHWTNLVLEKSIGTGIGKIWYRKKVSEPVSEKFGTRTDFCRQNFGILKIYNGYWYHIGTGTGNCSFFRWYRNRYRKYLVPEKRTGIGIVNIWYRKKYWNRYRLKFRVPSYSVAKCISKVYLQMRRGGFQSGTFLPTSLCLE